jgi:hypothetical protein
MVMVEIKRKGLKVKIGYTTKDYSSYDILFNKSKTFAWVDQPRLLKIFRGFVW